MVRYLHPTDHNQRTWKTDDDFVRELDFERIKFPVKIRDIHKIAKNELHQ